MFPKDEQIDTSKEAAEVRRVKKGRAPLPLKEEGGVRPGIENREGVKGYVYTVFKRLSFKFETSRRALSCNRTEKLDIDWMNALESYAVITLEVSREVPVLSSQVLRKILKTCTCNDNLNSQAV